MTISVNSRKKQSKKSFDELLNDLRTSNSEKVRYNAARVLGEMGDASAVEPLIDVLKNDRNGSVRLYAARALGELGEVSATMPLIEGINVVVLSGNVIISEKPLSVGTILERL